MHLGQSAWKKKTTGWFMPESTWSWEISYNKNDHGVFALARAVVSAHFLNKFLLEDLSMTNPSETFVLYVHLPANGFSLNYEEVNEREPFDTKSLLGMKGIRAIAGRT
jgi:hypothetical protein